MSAPEAPSTHLVLVRHGQSLHNRSGQHTLGPDFGLTELGWRQSQAVAAWLGARYRPTAVLTSPLVRARQTAEIIAARFELPLTLHEGLEEADFYWGDEIPIRWERPLAAWNHDWRPDAETAPLYSSFRARLYESLDVLLTRYAGQTVIAVTHGGAIGTIIRSLFGGHHVSVHTENTGVTQLTWSADSWRLVFHNYTAHLDTLNVQRPTATGGAAVPGQVSNDNRSDLIQKQYQRVAAALPRERVASSPKGVAELIVLAAPSPQDRVLDVGTGAGAVALALATRVGFVVGVDLSAAMLERAESDRAGAGVTNVHFRLGDILLLPLDDASFDIVICHNIFQYVGALPVLLRRLRRLLAPGGRLVADALVASDDPVRRATHNAIELRRDPGISEVCSVSDLERDLMAAGYRVVKLDRYSIPRELDEWLGQAAADETTRAAVRKMLEAGLEADSAGLNARRNRDGAIVFTESRARLLAVVRDRPA